MSTSGLFESSVIFADSSGTVNSEEDKSEASWGGSDARNRVPQELEVVVMEEPSARSGMKA